MSDKRRSAADLLRFLLEHGEWYASAIELDTYADVDGEELETEAQGLLAPGEDAEGELEAALQGMQEATGRLASASFFAAGSREGREIHALYERAKQLGVDVNKMRKKVMGR